MSLPDSAQRRPVRGPAPQSPARRLPDSAVPIRPGWF